MFICTNKGSVLLKGVPSATFNVVNTNRLIDSIKLSPNVEGERVDAIIVTSEDLSSKVVDDAFVRVLTQKHPDNVVIYIHKKAKLKDENRYAAANYVLVKPTIDNLRGVITEVISRSNREAMQEMETTPEVEEVAPAFTPGATVTETPVVEMSTAELPDVEPKEEFVPDTFVAEQAAVATSLGFTADGREVFMTGEGTYVDSMGNIVNVNGEILEQPNAVQEQPTTEIPNPVTEQVMAEPVATESVLAEMSDIPRIPDPSAADVNRAFASVVSTAELSRVVNDMNLEKIISEITEKNADYEQLEERITTLYHNIDRIMKDSDENTPTEEKLRRVNALKYEKSRCLGAKATVIEQHVDKIITTILNASIDAVTRRVREIEKIIVESRPTSNAMSSADIMAIKTNRTNALVELDCFLEELAAIEVGLRKVGQDAITLFIDESNTDSKDFIVNNTLRRSTAPIIPQETADAVKHLYETLSEIPDRMQTLANLIHTTKSLIHQVLDWDTRLIEQLEAAVERLSLSQIAKAGLAKTIAGRTIRTFIGGKRSGRSIIPYLFAKQYAKENGNVLYVNLCGNDKLARYGVQSATLGEFILNPIREDLAIVTGEICATTPIEEIASALQKATPFYKAIFLVVPEDNIEAVEVFTDMSLAFYCVCDLSLGNHMQTANLVATLSNKTCIKNVIFNRYDNVTVKGIELLGIDSTKEIVCFPIKNLDLLVTASINGEDPSDYNTVHTIFSTLRKYV